MTQYILTELTKTWFYLVLLGLSEMLRKDIGKTNLEKAIFCLTGFELYNHLYK